MPNWKTPAALALLSAGFAHAHLVASSLSIKGGEVFTVGQAVTLTWTEEEIHHKGIDIALSKDNGKTWSNVRTGGPDEDADGIYKWTVSNALTSQAKIRICQSGPCSDADNETKADGDHSPWYLISNAFTIQSTAAIASPSASDPLSLGFNPATGNVDVSFFSPAPAPVSLQAFDAQGRLVATLIQGGYAAGNHVLSVFSNRLVSASGSLLFKLQVGDQVKTHTWMTLR